MQQQPFSPTQQQPFSPMHIQQQHLQQWGNPPPWTQWQSWGTPPCPYPTTGWPRQPSPYRQQQTGLLGPRPQQAHVAAAISPPSYAPTDIQEAMHTLSISPPDAHWFMDTGATSHMTANGGFSDRNASNEM
ncbi:glutenin, low molecular weight subunit 1D1-like [Mercurialis annua]|uniref:glutenin, low molecular weight subunit 1D1-like n=1 Tax=Mercurialis annua TaxID=3986 RepID=UPI0024AE8FA2|nr:glutenin, low molecular weight subunit 1D1-like [Mercurialis annua]